MPQALRDRFHQMGAPLLFAPDKGVPLRWHPRCRVGMAPCLALFDPTASTGFVLRAVGPSLDAAFHLDGRVARLVVFGRIIDRPQEQETLLTEIFAGEREGTVSCYSSPIDTA